MSLAFSQFTRLASAIAFAAAMFTTTSTAQTTGKVGFNDYTINTFTSASTSCTALTFLGGGAITFSVDTAPGVPVALLFSPCLCTPNFWPLPTQPCPIPLSANFGTSNQSIDLNLSCPLITISGLTGSDGKLTFVIPLPGGLNFSTQAAAFHPCAVGFMPVLFTQAYDVTT